VYAGRTTQDTTNRTNKIHKAINLKDNSVRAVAADQSIKLWLVLGSDGVNVLGDLDACIYFKITISVSEVYNEPKGYLFSQQSPREVFQ